MRTKKTRERTKRYKLFMLLGLLFFFSCRSGAHLKLRIEIPRKPPIQLDGFEELVITNFLVKEEAEEFDMNKELSGFFSAEFGQKLEQKISSKVLTFENDEVFHNKEFWQALFPDRKGAVLFTGSLEYTQETRKAIKSLEKRQFETPFPEESRIEARKFYSLNLRVYLIDAQTGEALYEKDFKESKSYKNPNQTAHFAFIDLVQAVKDKLFRQLLGEEQIQERYLIK